MSFASDKLYKEYLLRKMPTIVSKVKVREIVPHLPCLTDHDRENIEAKRETYGNYDSMVLLLDCLKRRENWPEQFIDALEACDHVTIAAEVREKYNTLRGTNNSNPSSPPTTVIQAHIHPAPSAGRLSVPESAGNSHAGVAPPADASAPLEPAAQASAPLEIPVQPQASPSSAAQVSEAVSPPEPVAEPPQSARIKVAPAPSTPPPSPETTHIQAATTTPPPQREILSHQEPEENSESDVQDLSGDNAVIPDQLDTGNGNVSISGVNTPQPSGLVEQRETDTPAHPDPLQKTTTSDPEVRPPRSHSPAQVNSDVMSFRIMTPEKPPVQDTTPPVYVNPTPVLQPEETSEPPATQVVESSPQTEAAASPLPDAATVFLSKPGQLMSTQPQNHDSPIVPAPHLPVEPYSGNSERLEISEAAVTSAHIPACSAVSSTTMNTVTALPCQENGIAVNHNEPEENHYESPCQSLETQDVRVNVVQISEEPSILNLEGQSSTPQGQIVNGEAAKEITSAPPPPPPPCTTNAADTVLSVKIPAVENYHPSQPAPPDFNPELKTLQGSEDHTSSRTTPINTKYILTAAGVGACALLMAWKFKN
uniref:mitochondrial antiviral-signaling protein isoform X2 n=1 Tax=Scatophagus argus TaxID=75038 RepID=UPI001ED7FEDD|nr:mitochondrial antiviral-signaling protein isoform X2 [Scatophagus argus]